METPLEYSIVKSLAYFDLFDYPLSREEIHQFLGRKAGLAEVTKGLKKLVLLGLIFRKNDWYSLRNNADLHSRRMELNKRAREWMPRAVRISRILLCFPFVRAVCLSGSLSKNCAETGADIDFFLITKANRLWIARTFLHLLKKLAILIGLEHWLCMNYFVDEEGLSIQEKNIFTATEIVTLLPCCTNRQMDRFFEENSWVRPLFPNQACSRPAIGISPVFLLPRKLLEGIFNNVWGSKLDDFFMKLTSNRWQKKEDQHRLNIKGKRMGIRCEKHYCKPNPVYFQEKFLQHFDHRLTELEGRLLEHFPSQGQDFFRREII
jgi:hypothetical protein